MLTHPSGTPEPSGDVSTFRRVWAMDVQLRKTMRLKPTGDALAGELLSDPAVSEERHGTHGTHGTW